MEEYKVLINRIKEIKDYYVEYSEKRLKNDMPFSDNEKEYNLLKSIINTDESIKAYRSVINSTLERFIHTILVMLDNGDELADHFIIDIINYDTKKSITENIALHEEYEYTLYDNR